MPELLSQILKRRYLQKKQHYWLLLAWLSGSKMVKYLWQWVNAVNIFTSWNKAMLENTITKMAEQLIWTSS